MIVTVAFRRQSPVAVLSSDVRPMKRLALFLIVAMIAYCPVRSSAISFDEGSIHIGSYSGWMLNIVSDGSAGLVYGSRISNAAAIPKGTYDFKSLLNSLPKHLFIADPRKAKCFSVRVSLPQRTHDNIGHSCDRKFFDSLFETALRVGKPFAPEEFRKTTAYRPVVAK